MRIKKNRLIGCLALAACAFGVSAAAATVGTTATAEGIAGATFQMEEGGSVRLTSNDGFHQKSRSYQ